MPMILSDNDLAPLLADPASMDGAILDYWSLSPVRVGASGGVAARYLAPAGARVAGVLGSAVAHWAYQWATKEGAGTRFEVSV